MPITVSSTSLALRAGTLTLVATLSAPYALGAQAKRALDNDDLMRIRAVGAVAIAPAGGRVLYTVSGWEHPAARGDTALGDRHERRSHVWMVPFAGGPARQLTFGERGRQARVQDQRAVTIVSPTSRSSSTCAPLLMTLSE